MRARASSPSGFTLIETLIATGLILVVSSIATSALLQMSRHQQTVWNRTEMHSGIRGATELLQQEVGQAGRVTLPGAGTVNLVSAITLPSPVPPPCQPITASPYWSGGTGIVSATLSSVTGLWEDPSSAQKGIKLAILDGNNSETVTVQTINTTSKTITACFSKNHAGSTGTPVTVMALGGFAEGIIAPSPLYTAPWSTTTGTYTNGSDANHLKLFGDINGDGNLVYVEYFCDNGDVGNSPSHNLYRKVVAFNAGSKGLFGASEVLLSNVYPNPADNGVARPCFKYQWTSISGVQFVLDVAITLTVQTQQIDPVTRAYQNETKALLNVSPRNIFNVWTMAGYNEPERVQSTPPSVSAMLP